MPTKTKGKSPVTYDFSTATTSGGGASLINPAQQSAIGGAAGGISGAGALGAAGGAVGGIIDQFNTDPTAKGAIAGTATSEALKYGAMGAALGPIGAGVGAAIGLGVGIVKGKKAKKEAEEQERLLAEETKKANLLAAQNAENAKLAQNMAGAGVNPYDVSPVPMLTKKLKGIKGLVPANMSAAQYKSSLQMKEISGVNTLTN